MITIVKRFGNPSEFFGFFSGGSSPRWVSFERVSKKDF